MADHNYIDILSDLKKKIQQARQRAILAVNSQLLYAYWEIGNTILLQREKEGWGTKVVNRLIADLKAEFPDMRGLSIRNFNYMRAFAKAYPEFSSARPDGSLAADKQQFIIVQQLAAQLPWTHHQLLLDKTETSDVKRSFL